MKKIFTHSDTKMIHGLAVMAMVILHLFDNLEYGRMYIPVLYLFGKPVIFYIAQLSDFCVMGYAFCSGYALYKQFRELEIRTYYKRRLKSLLVLLVNYWLILFIFTIISILIGNGENMPGSVGEFIGNFLTVNTTYNGAWWYLFIYILLVLLSPWIFTICDRLPVVISSISLFGIYFSAYYVRFKMVPDNWWLVKYGLFGMTLAEFCIGVFFLKGNWLEILSRIIQRIPYWERILGSIVIWCGMLIGHTLIVPSLFVAPITGLIIIVLFTLWEKPKFIESIFLLMGKHSTNIWLIHMFFYLYLFKGLVYVVRYPLAILALMLVICIGCSYVINMLLQPVNKKITNWIK